MADKQVCHVLITSDKGRTVVVLNGMDISGRVMALNVDIVGGRNAIVTFKMLVDDLTFDSDASIGLSHIQPPQE